MCITTNSKQTFSFREERKDSKGGGGPEGAGKTQHTGADGHPRIGQLHLLRLIEEQQRLRHHPNKNADAARGKFQLLC